jgi:hypothetical protein
MRVRYSDGSLAELENMCLQRMWCCVSFTYGIPSCVKVCTVWAPLGGFPCLLGFRSPSHSLHTADKTVGVQADLLIAYYYFLSFVRNAAMDVTCMCNT